MESLQLAADVFDAAAWKSEATGAAAVVSCIGAFGSNEVRKSRLFFAFIPFSSYLFATSVH